MAAPTGGCLRRLYRSSASRKEPGPWPGRKLEPKSRALTDGNEARQGKARRVPLPTAEYSGSQALLVLADAALSSSHPPPPPSTRCSG